MGGKMDSLGPVQVSWVWNELGLKYLNPKMNWDRFEQV